MADSVDKFLSAPTSTKVATLILLMGVIGAGWYSLYFTEVQAAMSRESGRTGQLNKTIAEEKKILDDLGKIRAKIERGKAEQEAMLEKLPEAAEIAALLQQIEGTAKIVGLQILRFEPGDEEPEETYARIPVTMTLQGEFHQVKSFFEQVGKMTRIVNIEDISLTTIENTEQSTRVQAVCNATTFKYLKEQKKKKKKGRKKKKKRKGRKK
jgi:type IV pilus assembly protein PilO